MLRDKRSPIDDKKAKIRSEKEKEKENRKISAFRILIRYQIYQLVSQTESWNSSYFGNEICNGFGEEKTLSEMVGSLRLKKTKLYKKKKQKKNRPSPKVVFVWLIEDNGKLHCISRIENLTNVNSATY